MPQNDKIDSKICREKVIKNGEKALKISRKSLTLQDSFAIITNRCKIILYLQLLPTDKFFRFVGESP